MLININKKYKTVGGREVRIKHIDDHGYYPVHGLMRDENGAWTATTWTKNGLYYTTDVDNNSNLVEVDCASSPIIFTDDLDVIRELDLSSDNIEVYTSTYVEEEITEIIGNRKYTYEKSVRKWVAVDDQLEDNSYYNMCLSKNSGHWFFFPLWVEALEEKNE